MTFLAAGNENWQLKDLPQAEFGRYDGWEFLWILSRALFIFASFHFELTLIDQEDDPEDRENETKEVEGRNIPSFSRPITEENTGIGFDCFVSPEKLKSQHYIVDDTSFLQVEIRSPPY